MNNSDLGASVDDDQSMLITLRIANQAVTVARQIIRDVESITADRAESKFKIAGLAMAALLPAIFWTALLASFGSYFGFNISPSGLACTGGAIGLFLTAVCAPLIANA